MIVVISEPIRQLRNYFDDRRQAIYLSIEGVNPVKIARQTKPLLVGAAHDHKTPVPTPCVKPRNLNVSHRPAPRFLRNSLTSLPNSMRRVFCSWRVSVNFVNRYARGASVQGGRAGSENNQPNGIRPHHLSSSKLRMLGRVERSTSPNFEQCRPQVNRCPHTNSSSFSLPM
jgi:hypothetical protein